MPDAAQDRLLTPERLFLFVLLAVPGIIAMRVYGMRNPGPQKDWKDSFGDAVTFSVINAMGWAFVVRGLIPEWKFDLRFVLDHLELLFCYTLVTPTLLAVVWYKLRESVCHRWCGWDHPIRTAWDWAVKTAGGGPLYLIFVLKEKEKDDEGNEMNVRVGGLYGPKSYAATYPQEPEIFVEKLFKIQKNGDFGEKVPDTHGMVIKMSDCERIVFKKTVDVPAASVIIVVLTDLLRWTKTPRGWIAGLVVRCFTIGRVKLNRHFEGYKSPIVQSFRVRYLAPTAVAPVPPAATEPTPPAAPLTVVVETPAGDKPQIGDPHVVVIQKETKHEQQEVID
jgi:hypothetical protein